MDRDGGVEQAAAMHQRRAHDQHRQERGRLLGDVPDCLFDRVQKDVLLQQVLDRVAGYAEFGEDCDGHALLVAGSGDAQDGGGVGRRVGHCAVRHAGGDAGETVAVDRAEIQSGLLSGAG